ncbi:OprD family porin [Pseudomonas proteolytica]|uniref:Outer membrane porin, OprD family n=1 Tax=Pseudomonas proteolytica TaxID=219574 RepID=A0AAW5AID7_9PSED|nr:OprD family porin [Pseudomonas proteolytica]KAA8698620.1 OprD family porin [Pseudomonas proteolytica]MCF5060535.1 outer membrane porin, OprD family [Pseudomonas proteolytica]MCF5100676.1 outer membrane porin, OprD family [Pseudomonas proteolytica]TWR78365.1 OprD family porin [Pseudomonas proteolytica]USW96317.1 OprD family porin [Pseudomonas proteolytica]
MKKSTLAFAVAAGVLAQQAGAAGFVEDSKASVTARNFYINQDNRDGAAKPSKQEEWGQGFIFNFASGYTQGTVGFGVDAIGLYGVKLDSGKGTAYNNNSANKGGVVFPSDSDGRAVDDFASLGLTGKVKISKTELKLGTLLPKLPVVTSNDGRLLPQTFEGGQITSNEIDNLTLVGGKLEHAKGRNSSNNDSLTIAGSNGATRTATANARSNEFYYAGGDYKITKDLVAQYYYGNLSDFYKQHFLGLTHNWALPVGSIKSDLRYFNSDSDGKNSSQEGRIAGYRASGYQNGGEVDNRTWSAKFTYSLQGHAISAGYQRVNGTSDFPFLNQGDGASSYLITDMQIGKFQRAGERTWLAQYAYDFATIGLPGLTTSVVYLKGDNIATSTGDKGEWERDFNLGYVIPEGTFKGLGLAWKNASLRSQVASQRDQDENRLIVSYTLPIL